MIANLSASELLGSDGPFAREVQNFAPRESQQDMAEAVEEAIADGQMLIAEAGTGTGKTFAYLVPALRSGKRVIVSTGTKTLQDQLFHRDLPRVREVLGARLRTSLLKGRANYLCLYRLEQTREGWAFHFARAGRASAVDPRLGAAHRQRRSRRICRGAGGFAAVAARDVDRGELPRRRVSDVRRLLRRQGAARGAGSRSRRRQPPSAVRRSGDQAGRLRRNPAGRAGLHPRRGAPDSGTGRRILFHQRNFAADHRARAGRAGRVRDRSPVRWRACANRSRRSRRLRQARASRAGQVAAQGRVRADRKRCGDRRRNCMRSTRRCASWPPRWRRRRIARAAWPACTNAPRRCASACTMCSTAARTNAVHWYELSPHGFSLHATPLDLAPPLRALREQSRASWIFTSATLSVAGDFDHFARQLGLDDPVALSLPSPFDYATPGAGVSAEGTARSERAGLHRARRSPRRGRCSKRRAGARSCCSPRIAR